MVEDADPYSRNGNKTKLKICTQHLLIQLGIQFFYRVGYRQRGSHYMYSVWYIYQGYAAKQTHLHRNNVAFIGIIKRVWSIKAYLTWNCINLIIHKFLSSHQSLLNLQIPFQPLILTILHPGLRVPLHLAFCFQCSVLHGMFLHHMVIPVARTSRLQWTEVTWNPLARVAINVLL